ncbi:MAG: hypothetical protein ACREO8_02650 [Luteimonas sp.]
MLSLSIVKSNQATMVNLFGKYTGTVKDNDLRLSNRFCTAEKVSQRVRPVALAGIGGAAVAGGLR